MPAVLGAALALLGQPRHAWAQETPYLVAYPHHLEEPGSLELALRSTSAPSRPGNAFSAAWMEVEYGATAWWTTELYLDAQATRHEGALFTGWKWENRFRILMREHAVNPVVYLEYENVNGADKTLKDVVGFDGAAENREPNGETRQERERELETKLILSSDIIGGWNLSENLIGARNLEGEPWEFGYAMGVSRPLRLEATPDECSLCRENFVAGLELYGGLGTAEERTLAGTSHYIAPSLSWQLPSGTAFTISPAWGLTGESHRFLLRFGVAHEIPALGPY